MGPARKEIKFSEGGNVDDDDDDDKTNSFKGKPCLKYVVQRMKQYMTTEMTLSGWINSSRSLVEQLKESDKGNWANDDADDDDDDDDVEDDDDDDGGGGTDMFS